MDTHKLNRNLNEKSLNHSNVEKNKRKKFVRKIRKKSSWISSDHSGMPR
jgi:hypothetical protein